MQSSIKDRYQATRLHIRSQEPTFHRWPLALWAVSPFPASLWEPLFYSLLVWVCLHQCPLGLPRWLSGKESVCQCRRCRRPRFHPWVRKIPWRRKWQPTLVFLPEKFHGERSLAGYSLETHEESDTTEAARHAVLACLSSLCLHFQWLSMNCDVMILNGRFQEQMIPKFCIACHSE